MVPLVDPRSAGLFPAALRGLKGRVAELGTLSRTLLATAPTRLALVGAGGSGKSVLAAALAHRLASRFAGGIHWFRVGAWDFRTLTEMLALRFATTRDRHAVVTGLRAYLTTSEQLVILRVGDSPTRAAGQEWDNAMLPNTILRGIRRKAGDPVPQPQPRG